MDYDMNRDKVIYLNERPGVPPFLRAPDSAGEMGHSVSLPRGPEVEFAVMDGIVGCSPALKGVLNQVGTVAPADSTVLIQGETGTGKELIAKAIHMHSRRRTCAFVTMNCAAIPRELLESEIFGHEKGAFTGAVTRRIGRFEAANHGTLLLDEIGDMPLELQAKVLRVLQEQEFERLGSSGTKHVNVRILAATNQDLDQLVSEKRFRTDLYYRLNVFPIFIPPLRSRREDIPLLVGHFVDVFAERMNKHIEKIPSNAMDAFMHYDWPGNVRELQNFIERSVILTTGDVLNPPVWELAKRRFSRPITIEDCERAHILKTVEESNGVIGGRNGAAARLGIARSTLMYRMRKLGIANDRRERRAPAERSFASGAIRPHHKLARGAAQA